MFYRSIIAVAAVVSLLAACGPLQQQQAEKRMREMETRVAAAKAQCGADFDAGVYKTNEERAHCVNRASTAIATEAGFPFMRYLRKCNEQRLELSRRMDRHELSKDQAARLYDDYAADVFRQEQAAFQQARQECEYEALKATAPMADGNVFSRAFEKKDLAEKCMEVKMSGL
jgi:hypothetical protein